MATDKESLTLRLRLACVGHPTAEIPWPHRILHEAADEIATLTSKLERMREIAYKMDACGLGSIDAPEWLDELLREVGES